MNTYNQRSDFCKLVSEINPTEKGVIISDLISAPLAISNDSSFSTEPVSNLLSFYILLIVLCVKFSMSMWYIPSNHLQFWCFFLFMIKSSIWSASFLYFFFSYPRSLSLKSSMFSYLFLALESYIIEWIYPWSLPNTTLAS